MTDPEMKRFRTIDAGRILEQRHRKNILGLLSFLFRLVRVDFSLRICNTVFEKGKSMRLYACVNGHRVTVTCPGINVFQFLDEKRRQEKLARNPRLGRRKAKRAKIRMEHHDGFNLTQSSAELDLTESDSD